MMSTNKSTSYLEKLWQKTLTGSIRITHPENNIEKSCVLIEKLSSLLTTCKNFIESKYLFESGVFELNIKKDLILHQAK